MLYELEIAGAFGGAWRLRGATPPFDQWRETLANGVLCQFIVERYEALSQERDFLGYCTTYDPVFEHGYAYFAAAKIVAVSGLSPDFLIGCCQVLDRVFSAWSFRKIYMTVPEYNLSTIRSGLGRLLKEEGRLRSHTYWAGVYHDEYIVALYKEDWVDFRERAHRILATEPLRPGVPPESGNHVRGNDGVV